MRHEREIAEGKDRPGWLPWVKMLVASSLF